MFARIADLTWKHPKLVLAAVGAFAVLAIAVGKDVEHHLKAAGFTDPASESEKAKDLLTDALGYDPNPGIVLVVRAPGGGPLDLRSPAVRRQVDRLSRQVSRVDDVGRVVNPLHDRRAGAELIAADGSSLVLLVDLSDGDLEDRGGIVAEDVEPLADASRLDVSMGGYAPSFNEVNDQTKKDLTKAELIAFPILALLLLLVFRGVVAAGDPAADRRDLDRRHPLRPAGDVAVRRHLGLRAQHRDRAQPRARGRLRAADGLALPRGDRARRRDAGGAPAHGETAGRTALFSGLTVAAAMAALAILPQRFLYSMAVAGASVGLLSAVIALLVVPSLLALLGTRIDALSIRRGAAVSDESDGWYRLARWVMRHPVGVALASTALLLAAAAPLLWTTLTGPNSDFVPHNKPAYEANSYVEAHYPRDVTEAVTVTVDGPASRAAAGRLQPAGDGDRRHRPRHPLRRAPPTASPTPTSPSPGRRSPRNRRTPSTRSATWPRRRRARSWSPATRPASSTRSRASPTTCRC